MATFACGGSSARSIAGIVVNPDTVRAQIEGAIIFGITAALFGEITLKDGRVEQTNFDTYQILRMNEAPAIEVHIVQSVEPPGGMGEPGTSAIVPAVTNAIFAAIGKRLRKLPIDTAALEAAGCERNTLRLPTSVTMSSMPTRLYVDLLGVGFDKETKTCRLQKSTCSKVSMTRSVSGKCRRRFKNALIEVLGRPNRRFLSDPSRPCRAIAIAIRRPFLDRNTRMNDSARTDVHHRATQGNAVGTPEVSQRENSWRRSIYRRQIW